MTETAPRPEQQKGEDPGALGGCSKPKIPGRVSVPKVLPSRVLGWPVLLVRIERLQNGPSG